MHPVVSGLDEKYGERVAVAGIDYYADENAALVREHRVPGHPTFVVLSPDGEVAGQFVGGTSAAALEAAILKALAK